jgi:ABC-type molybdate transport system substrate-binding protein
VPEVRQIELDRAFYDPIVQYMGIVARTSNPGAAKQLADFFLSDEGQELLVSFGFAPVGRRGK